MMIPGLVRARAHRRLAGPHVLHRAAGDGHRRGDRAPAPVVHVALLSGGAGWVHRRSSRGSAPPTGLFAATLALGGVLIGDERSPLAIVLPSVAIGAAVAFLLIEPVTTRDAFKQKWNRT